MTNFQPARPVSLILALCFGLTLAACDGVSALSGPTYELTIASHPGRSAHGEQDQRDPAAIAEESLDVIRQRLDALGVGITDVRHLGDGRIVVTGKGKNAKAAIANIIGHTGELSIQLVDRDATSEQIEQDYAPVGSEILPFAEPEYEEALALRRLGGISGDRIIDARADENVYSGEPVVRIQLDAQGGAKFARMSSENVGQRFAIVIDGKIISAPVVAEPILGGSMEISGAMTAEEAKELAIMLRSGALKVPFRIVSERTLD